MKKLLAALALTPSIAFGEVQPFEIKFPIMCGSKENLLQGLQGQYGEELLFAAPDLNDLGETLIHSLWINKTTRTWTFTVVNEERSTLCVISSGKEAVILKGETI